MAQSRSNFNNVKICETNIFICNINTYELYNKNPRKKKMIKINHDHRMINHSTLLSSSFCSVLLLFSTS